METREQIVARLTTELTALMRAHPWLIDVELAAILESASIPIANPTEVGINAIDL